MIDRDGLGEGEADDVGGAEESEGTAAPGARTSRDVARLCSVLSRTAVSFVFSGRAENGNLSLAAQERIKQAATTAGLPARQAGWPAPRPAPRCRRAGLVIGLVADEIASSPFAGRLLRGAMETAWDRDHLVLTVDSGGDPAQGGRRPRRAARPARGRHHLRGHVTCAGSASPRACTTAPTPCWPAACPRTTPCPPWSPPSAAVAVLRRGPAAARCGATADSP
ncbi:hypothetical protein ACRAWF_41380 [Streptomyces sp. L7]